MIAEGAFAVKPVYELARSHQKKLKTPIIDAVYRVVENKEEAALVFEELKQKLD